MIIILINKYRIVYFAFKGLQVKISTKCISALKIAFISANSVDPDENATLCGISSGSSLFAKLLDY